MTYSEVWPGTDLAYVVTGSAVKETVLIKSKSAGSSFTFAMTAGAATDVSKGAGTAPAAVVNADGSVTLSSSATGPVSVSAPMVVDATGLPLEDSGAKYTVAAGGRLTLSLDPTWLAAQPVSAFPIRLDPSVISPGVVGQWDYKSDGYSCSNCGLRVGNSRDSGDRYWRSISGFNWSALAGTQILDAALTVNVASGGLGGSMPVSAWATSGLSYAGSQGGGLVASGVTNSVLGGQALHDHVQYWANAGVSTDYIGFSGDARAGVYTFQMITVSLSVTFNHQPGTPVLASPSPGSGSSFHALAIGLGVASTDADGDTLQYLFEASLDPGFATKFYTYGWGFSNTAPLQLDGSFAGKTVYWHAYASDGAWWSAASPTYTFTVLDQLSTLTSVSPVYSQGSTPVVSTTTPVLSAVAADADATPATIEYNFTISGGSDTVNGKASSGWLTPSGWALSWTVPAGVLEEGQQYSWSVSVREKYNAAATWTEVKPSPAPQLKVDRRMGSGGPAPVDSLGGASVNLANGNLFLSAAGHGVSSVGGSLAVGLSYNSQLATVNGLVGSYYQENDRNWTFDTGELPSLVRVDSLFDLAWNTGTGVAAAPPGMAADQFLVKWVGYLTVPTSNTGYEFGVRSDDGVRIILNGSTTVYDDWTAHPAPAGFTWSNPTNLAANSPVKVEIDYYNFTGPAVLQVKVKSADAQVAEQLLPSSWLTPGASTVPAGWSVSLPGGGTSYTKASVGYQSVVLTDSSGQGHTYTQKTGGAVTATSVVGYTPPAGESGVLSGTPATGWTLIDGDGSVYTFDTAGLPLTAQSALDTAHPAAATYAYDTTVTPARVKTIHDPVSNQDINLSYGTVPGAQTDCPAKAPWDAAPVNMLCKVSYWDGTATILHYTNGQLAAVEEPGNAITQFGYGEGLLTQIRGVLANDLLMAAPSKIGDSPQTYTQIAYTWALPTSSAQETSIRPTYSVATVGTGGLYPAGSVPMVASVTGPAPDGSASETNRPQHSYDYTASPSTTKVSVKGITEVASIVTYDSTGRTLTTQNAADQTTMDHAVISTWDAAGKDLPVSTTDTAGRMTTTVYDWADRATDSFGPALAKCFDSTGRPVATSDPDCAAIPHSHTGYDTDTSGQRYSQLSLDQYNTSLLTGQPTSRTTATSLNPSSWPLTVAGTSSRLTGEVALAQASYTFSANLADTSDDGIRVYIGDQLVIDRWWTLRQAVKADLPDAYWPLNGVAPDTGVGVRAAGTWTNHSVTLGAAAIGHVDTTSTASFVPGGSFELANGFAAGNASPTVELWFKTSTASAVLLSTDNQASGSLTAWNPILDINSSGQLQGGFYSGALTTMIASDPVTGAPLTVTDGNWHHVVLSTAKAPLAGNTSASQTLFLDGTLVGTSKTAVNLQGSTVKLGVGDTNSWPGLPGGWTWFNGTLGSVAFYDHPLDQTEVNRHYQGGVATLTSTTPISFTAFTSATAPVAGTLPAAPVSVPQRVRIEYRNIHQAATSNSFTLNSITGGATTPIPLSAFSTRYGLATWQTTDDAGGAGGTPPSPDRKLTTATIYSGSGLDLQYGLATSTIADPAGAAVTTSTAYEDPVSSTLTYLRATGSALTSGTLADPTKSTTISYYGASETRANPCVTGALPVNQAGLAKLSTKPAAADGSQIQEESVYDAAGRVVAARYASDPNPVWTCTSYDTRGRPTTVTTPAWGSDTNPRTVTTNYAVGGDARVSSVSDGTGTTSATVDLLGRSVSYTDTTGLTTTTVFDVTGRVKTVSTGSAPSSTLAYTYRDDGKVLTETLDGATPALASVTYDNLGEVSEIDYPFGKVDNLLKYPSGSLKSDTWTITQSPTNRTFTEQITRSQSGRVIGSSWTDSSTTANSLSWGYSYDTVGRLTKAVLAAAGSRTDVTFGYSFAKTGGCGTDPAAGANGSRTGSTVQIGTGTIASSAYCYDYASRLTSVTGANAIAGSAISYDSHGNATRIGDQTWTYDAADRVTGTTAGSTGETLAYTRDVSGRVKNRVATGPDAGTTLYGFSSSDDSPDFQLDASNTITERYLSLPGGVLVTKPYNQPTATTSYSIPNWHGDVTAQANITSNLAIAVSGGNWVSDPYGQPVNATTGATDLAATPTTRSGTGTTDSWLGKNQRGYEHASALNQMLMGARTYMPALGLFTSTDPIPGGSATAYDYCNQDPINSTDPGGTSPRWWDYSHWGKVDKWMNRACAVAWGACVQWALMRTTGLAYQGNITSRFINLSLAGSAYSADGKTVQLGFGWAVGGGSQWNVKGGKITWPNIPSASLLLVPARLSPGLSIGPSVTVCGRVCGGAVVGYQGPLTYRGIAPAVGLSTKGINMGAAAGYGMSRIWTI